MSVKFNNAPIEELLETIGVPDSAYEKAEARYKNLGEWFNRGESKCSAHVPHVFLQGSFRLGTVIRPVGGNGEYDLDLGCRLQAGIGKSTHSQKHLKELVGNDLEDYRIARKILSKLEPKHRCWRLRYADELSFHMDIVPSIPEEQQVRTLLKEAMANTGMEESLAESVSQHAGAITDDRLPSYPVISPHWRISNSEGYALWFESRMRLAQPILERRALARLDAMPARSWKSPLQQVVQLLKWHRDHMFQKNPDSKPISVILTTLAAHSYGGEPDVATALNSILARFGDYVQKTAPRVPNPINPAEDFADKWADPAYRHLDLENNFWRWLEKARSDFNVLGTTTDSALFERTSNSAFGAALPKHLDALKTNERRLRPLMEKAEQIKTGARTNAAGVIGAAGIANLPHKFYGDEEIHPEGGSR